MESNSNPPSSYSGLNFKDIAVTHVPAEAVTATKVVVVAFNRPKRFNAVTANMLAELEEVYKMFEKDQRVRSIVLTGTGKAFSSGADLSVGFSELFSQKESEESMRNFRDQGGRVALAIANCTKPTIAAINGPAAGAGLTLALPSCIRVAWEGAKVSLPFSRRGLTLESCSAFYLPRLIGLSNAMHLATTGQTLVATDALVRGLFSRLLPSPEETMAHAIELAGDIAENTSLTSTKLIRDMLVYCPPTPEETHLLDSRIFISVVGSKDNMEGVNSFMEKRRPQFSGIMDRSEVPFWPWWKSSSNRATGSAQDGVQAKI